MKWLFMLCNNCNRLATQAPVGCSWVVDNLHCTCIFLEVADDQA